MKRESYSKISSNAQETILSRIKIIQEEDHKKINNENNSKNDNSNIEFSDISDKINENEDNSYMEKQLSLLLEVFTTTYSKKSYKELIKEIEEKEILLYCNSIISFKIMVLKIKCLLKILLTEYNNLLISKNINYHDIDSVSQNIQNEFKKISNMAINNNSYEYEIMTQIYCKFLYLLSKISLKKEDNIKSLGFITLGINLLKAFFIKKKIAIDIKTYKIYSKLMLSLINTLIGDNNFEQALLYCRSLLKIIETSQRFINFCNKGNNEENHISPFTSKKFMKYTGYAFLFSGCCFEQFGNDLQALESYRQAKFFLEKGAIAGNPFKNSNIVTINTSCNYLANDLFDKLNLKFQREKLEKFQKQNKLEELKKIEKFQLLQNEKQIKLKLIACGYIGDPFKYNKLEEKIEKILFPSSIKNDLDKIDDELMSFVTTYYNKNNIRGSFRNKISTKTKQLISRYELYNILMSKEFRDFVMKNKKLQFNNPKKGSESISIIQRYLNNKMEIKSEIKHRNNTHKKTMKYQERKNNSINLINLRIKNKINDGVNSLTIPTTCPNSNRIEEKEDYFFTQFTSRNRENPKKIKNNFYTSPNKVENNSYKNRISGLQFISKSKNISASKRKINFKINLNELECDFERNNFDKNLMTKNYLDKYSYYENLSNRELKMQKALLDFRSNNTLYNSKKKIENNENEILKKDQIINKFNFINESVKNKFKIADKNEEIQLIKDSFFSGDNSKLSEKMTSAMSRVINKYILESKKKNAKKKFKIMNKEEIKQLNEKNLLELNFSIKALKNNIFNIRKLAGNKISDKIYN